MKSGTHARWLTDCADRLLEAQLIESDQLWKHYSNVAHQISQARPIELREFVESYPADKSLRIAPLMVLAWRIVGNEFCNDMASKATESIQALCDLDESEKATEAFAPID